MNDRGLRVTIGVLLILVGTVVLVPAVENALGPLALRVMGFPLITFALFCGGLWLVVAPAKRG